VQLARRRGAGTVIATADSAAKLAFVKELGADVAVDHTEPGWADQMRSAAPGGLDVVLEAVGGETLRRSLGLLAPFGRAVVFGASAGELTSVPVVSLFGLKTVSRALDSRAGSAVIVDIYFLYSGSFDPQ
jgi:NADPH2:quinone reductase